MFFLFGHIFPCFTHSLLDCRNGRIDKERPRGWFQKYLTECCLCVVWYKALFKYFSNFTLLGKRLSKLSDHVWFSAAKWMSSVHCFSMIDINVKYAFAEQLWNCLTAPLPANLTSNRKTRNALTHLTTDRWRYEPDCWCYAKNKEAPYQKTKCYA